MQKMRPTTRSSTPSTSSWDDIYEKIKRYNEEAIAMKNDTSCDFYIRGICDLLVENSFSQQGYDYTLDAAKNFEICFLHLKTVMGHSFGILHSKHLEPTEMVVHL